MEPDRPEQTTALACCADLYQSDLARLLLGDSLHPGGLRLTHRLGALMGIQPDDWVVDLACGRGISGMAVSRTFRCKVAGIEYGAAAVADAHAGARDAAVPARAFFINADAGLPPIRPSSVDAVLCECSMSIFADQPGAIIQAARMLRPGGILGLSDVTVKPRQSAGRIPRSCRPGVVLDRSPGCSRIYQIGGGRRVDPRAGRRRFRRNSRSAERTGRQAGSAGGLAVAGGGDAAGEQGVAGRGPRHSQPSAPANIRRGAGILAIHGPEAPLESARNRRKARSFWAPAPRMDWRGIG